MIDKKSASLTLKKFLRHEVLSWMTHPPVIMETHAGYGVLFDFCYSKFSEGVCFEQERERAEFLSAQRPAWAVYNCDVVNGLQHGLGNHLPVNFVDIDAYGETWSTIDAFLRSDRPHCDKIYFVATDGLREKLKTNSGWQVAILRAAVLKYGNEYLYKNYAELCKEHISNEASHAGYSLYKWKAYYCLKGKTLTHYAGILEKLSVNDSAIEEQSHVNQKRVIELLRD